MGMDGRVREFEVRFSGLSHEGRDMYWEYEVRRPDELDCFQARFLLVHDGLLQSFGLTANGVARYRKVGLPEAIIEFTAAHSGKRVESSSNTRKRRENESRNDSATKAWRRLEAAGRATYDPTSDRFTFVPR